MTNLPITGRHLRPHCNDAPSANSEPVEDDAVGATMLDNWRRQNEEIRRQLLAVKQEIEAAEMNNSSPLLQHPPPTSASTRPHLNPSIKSTIGRLGNREEAQKRLCEENRSLNNIVAQVKRDLEQAAMTSPAIIN